MSPPRPPGARLGPVVPDGAGPALRVLHLRHGSAGLGLTGAPHRDGVLLFLRHHPLENRSAPPPTPHALQPHLLHRPPHVLHHLSTSHTTRPPTLPSTPSTPCSTPLIHLPNHPPSNLTFYTVHPMFYTTIHLLHHHSPPLSAPPPTPTFYATHQPLHPIFYTPPTPTFYTTHHPDLLHHPPAPPPQLKVTSLTFVPQVSRRTASSRRVSRSFGFSSERTDGSSSSSKHTPSSEVRRPQTHSQE